MSLFFFQLYPEQNKAAETAVRKEMLRKRQSKIFQTGSTYLLTPKTKYGSAKELQFPCTCAGEPTTYTMDSVHTAGPVYPFSGKYARKILRLDGSILCLLQTPCRSLYLHGVLFSHERKERHSEENL